MEDTINRLELESVRVLLNETVDKDEKASVTENDAQPNYLAYKLVAGDRVSMAVVNPGGVETLQVSADQQVPTPSGVDGRILAESSGVPGWVDPPIGVPTPTGVDGRVLTESGGIAGWADPSSGGGGETYTLGSMNIQINYATGYDGPAVGEALFTLQSEVDAYLLSKGATAFKYPTKVWDRAIPDNIWHQVRFYMQPGVHRPENPLPAGASAAWDFCRTDANTKPKTFKKNAGYLTFYQGPTSDDYYNTWESLLGDLTVTGSNSSWSGTGGTIPPYYTVSGTPFGADNSLVGYWVITNNNFLPREILANTANTVYLQEGIVAGTTTIRVCSPSAIFRNSYDDLTKVNLNTFNFQTLSKIAGTAYVGYDSIRIDQFSGGVGIVAKDCFLATWCVLFDHARQKNLYPYSSSFGRCINGTNGNTYESEGGQIWQTSCRGATLATVPATSTQEPFVFTGTTGRRSGTLSLISIPVAGFKNGCSVSGMKVSLSDFRWMDCVSSGNQHSMVDCDVLLQASHLNGGYRTNMGLSFQRCNMSGGSNQYDSFFMDGFTGGQYSAMFQFWNCQMRESSALGFVQGANANGGYGVLIVGPRSALWLRRLSTLTGTYGEVHVAGNLWQDVTNRTKYTWANLGALRGVRFQPSDSIIAPAPAVTVVDADPGLTVTTSGNPLVIDGTAKTATFNDGGGVGSATSIATGGLIKVNAASGRGVLLQVYPNLLTAGSFSTNLDVYYGRLYLPWHDILIGIV